MSFDLTHGFLAEAQLDLRTVARIFAANFLDRVGLFRTTVAEGSDLTIWFDRPQLTLVEDPDPAVARAQVELRMIARLSDRIDEARIFVTARAAIIDRKVTVGTEVRACPAVDFEDSPASDITVTFSNNPEYDAVVLTAVTALLRRESPFALGPLAAEAGKRFYRTYFDVPGHEQGLLVFFVGIAELPTPPTVASHLHATRDVVLLVPDAMVDIRKGLEQAGLGTLPAPLNPDVLVRTLDVSLQQGHIRIAGSATKTSSVLGIPIDTDFTFTAFVQPVVENGEVGIHVISTQQDLDGAFTDFADFLSAGALTRLMEEMVPAAVAGLSLGTFEGLDFFADTVADGDDSAPATVGSLLDVFSNGIGIPYEVTATVPAELQPPYIRGHLRSREFHVAGCRFGDLITANLRRFPSPEAAIRAGYDGCATCQAEFNVAAFGDLSVEVAHPAGVEPGAPVTVRAAYAGDLVRFGVTLAPDAEEDTSASPFDNEGTPTHRSSFDRIVPAPWTVTVTCGGWSVESTVEVGVRFVDAEGTLQGARTQVRATVGEPDLEPDGG